MFSFCSPIFLDSDNQLPDEPMLNPLFDCTLPDPYVLNTYNSSVGGVGGVVKMEH